MKQYYLDNKKKMNKQTTKWIKNNPMKFKIINDRSKFKANGQKTMSDNKNCSQFLGIYVAERVLSYVFENVIRQPYGTPGFDFICNKGKKIDVKSACMFYGKWGAPSWNFRINKNKIADYFLCLAFDDRDNLTPMHIWLIPAPGVNKQIGISTSTTMISKWDKYALDINKVSNCCNIMKGEHL